MLLVLHPQFTGMMSHLLSSQEILNELCVRYESLECGLQLFVLSIFNVKIVGEITKIRYKF